MSTTQVQLSNTEKDIKVADLETIESLQFKDYCGFKHCDADTRAESRRVMRKLFIISISASIFMVIELVGGAWSGSLAIMTDAAH